MGPVGDWDCIGPRAEVQSGSGVGSNDLDRMPGQVLSLTRCAGIRERYFSRRLNNLGADSRFISACTSRFLCPGGPDRPGFPLISLSNSRTDDPAVRRFRQGPRARDELVPKPSPRVYIALYINGLSMAPLMYNQRLARPVALSSTLYRVRQGRAFMNRGFDRFLHVALLRDALIS